ncbi:putative 4-mercaptohistidine N1-methyltransferase [Balamuthia mandrillaris]
MVDTNPNNNSKQQVALAVAGVVVGVAVGAALTRWLHPTPQTAAAAASQKHQHQPQQRKGVRSTTDSGSVSASAVYESEKALNEYLLFHFGSREEVLPYEEGPVEALAFAQRCAEECGLVAKQLQALLQGGAEEAGQKRRALDVGCAVGGSTFQLARYFEEVVGVDFSESFVRAAATLQQEGELSYSSLVTGEVRVPRVATLPPDIDRSRCSFRVGDACDLHPEELGTFDCVLAANLLCRLPQPQRFLFSLNKLLRPNGILFLVSPYSWLEEYTAKELWLGGRASSSAASTLDAGTGQDSFESLRGILEEQGFTLLWQKEMPFLIREHQRKFQWGCSHATMWQKTASASASSSTSNNE